MCANQSYYPPLSPSPPSKVFKSEFSNILESNIMFNNKVKRNKYDNETTCLTQFKYSSTQLKYLGNEIMVILSILETTNVPLKFVLSIPLDIFSCIIFLHQEKKHVTKQNVCQIMRSSAVNRHFIETIETVYSQKYFVVHRYQF